MPPRIIEQPVAEVIYEENNKDVKITCVADGVPSVEYYWEKNQMEFDLNKENIKTENGTGSFTFKELHASDAGE